MSGPGRLLAALVTLAAALIAGHGNAAGQDCSVVKIEMTPSPELQIVIWLEDEAGTYVDTLFITRMVGSYGLGNRPGMMEFNSAWRWPYGRRTTTFPVWAHRHGMEWPEVVFQNLDESNLSHPLGQSSLESFYCRPLRDGETMWDTQTCSSTVFTDKGVLSTTRTSLYPPRADLTYTSSIDDESVQMFESINPFDAVSRPTPPGDLPFALNWPIPQGFPPGNYVIWVEVNKEFDQNQSFDYPAPVGIPWSEYGLPYRGQPSVVYRVPFTIGPDNSVASTAEYAGYGDPDEIEGIDGNLRPPDDTMITTGVDGSGASRLLLTADGAELYRVRVSSRPTFDVTNPGVLEDMRVVEAHATSVIASFVAPSDDLADEQVTGYEVRYMVGDSLTEENFADATVAAVTIVPDEPGIVQLVTINELTPRTQYTIGIRAYDECRNYGPLATLQVTTTEREIGTVDWCFVATAAYGSSMDVEVDVLRRFRDRFLRTHAAGELMVEGYYTFGPALARLIGPSDTLRRLARAGLAPIVEAAEGLSPGQ